jgi:hypothetical protein
MILLAYRHGLRVAKLCHLRWDQVDLQRKPAAADQGPAASRWAARPRLSCGGSSPRKHPRSGALRCATRPEGHLRGAGPRLRPPGGAGGHIDPGGHPDGVGEGGAGGHIDPGGHPDGVGEGGAGGQTAPGGHDDDTSNTGGSVFAWACPISVPPPL